MTKIPNSPQDAFVPLTEDYMKVFGKELISLILYGSAAGGSYIKGKSDINLLVVLTQEGMDKLADSFEIVKYWQKRRVAIPLVMTKNFINSSLDCYPIEFMNMKNNHTLIYGENILEQIEFHPESMRLQIERELKGKLLLLREGYLETQGKALALKDLISRSFTAIVSIFNALLYYKQGNAPHERRDTIKEMSKIYEIDEDTFFRCADIKEGKNKLSSKDIEIIFNKYVRQIANICNIVDSL